MNFGQFQLFFGTVCFFLLNCAQQQTDGATKDTGNVNGGQQSSSSSTDCSDDIPKSLLANAAHSPIKSGVGYEDEATAKAELQKAIATFEQKYCDTTVTETETSVGPNTDAENVVAQINNPDFGGNKVDGWAYRIYGLTKNKNKLVKNSEFGGENPKRITQDADMKRCIQEAIKNLNLKLLTPSETAELLANNGYGSRAQATARSKQTDLYQLDLNPRNCNDSTSSYDVSYKAIMDYSACIYPAANAITVNKGSAEQKCLVLVTLFTDKFTKN